MPKRIGYLGPPGTFSEEALVRYDRDAVRLPFPSFRAVADAVQKGMADEGVVAIENSIEGSVNDTLDMLIHDTDLRIKDEIVVPVEQYLLVKPGTHASDIRVVYSHPQALGQCRNFLNRTFPQVQTVASLSTVAAVEQMLQASGHAAAIAPRRAADLYPVSILTHKVHDNPNNATRFVVLAHEDHAPTGADKTSLCITFAEDKPGSLYRALGVFALRNINLAKIESRPSKESLGKYVFLIDLEGHRADRIVAEALAELQQFVSTVKVFGSYPRARG
jgi:prephenate dehydratase